MWVRVNLSSLPAELYPHIASAIADSFCIITMRLGFVKTENEFLMFFVENVFGLC